MKLWIFLLLFGCGHPQDKKHYYFSVPDEYRTEFMDMFRQFNAHFGEQILHVTDKMGFQNSTVQVVQQEGAFIGRGAPGFRVHIHVASPIKTVKEHYMELEFDPGLMAQGYQSGNLQNYVWRTFLHEVGHGLGMDHVKDPENIMNPTMSRNWQCIDCFFEGARHHYDNFWMGLGY